MVLAFLLRALIPGALLLAAVAGATPSLAVEFAPKTMLIPDRVGVSPAFSVEALDMRGYEPSLYRGIWYDPDAEFARKCIMRRESGFRYFAANKTSSARGAYQFLDNNWRISLTWMFIAESKETGDGLADDARALRSKPISEWNRYWQDRAFYTAWRFGKGRHHWYHGSIRCY